MAADYFLKIENVRGESAVVDGAIEVNSWSWGATNSGSMSTGGLGSGRAVVQPFRFVAPTSGASVDLFAALMAGTALPSAVLTVSELDPSGKPVVHSTYTLSNCRVVEYFVGGPGDVDGDGLSDVDTFSLNWQKMRIEQASAKGGPKTAGWDLATNKKV